MLLKPRLARSFGVCAARLCEESVRRLAVATEEVYDSNQRRSREGAADADDEQTTSSGNTRAKREQSISLPTVFLPKELQSAIDTVFSGKKKKTSAPPLGVWFILSLPSGYSSKELAKDGQDLTAYLTNRVPPGTQWTKEKDSSMRASEHGLHDLTCVV